MNTPMPDWMKNHLVDIINNRWVVLLREHHDLCSGMIIWRVRYNNDKTARADADAALAREMFNLARMSAYFRCGDPEDVHSEDMPEGAADILAPYLLSTSGVLPW